MPLQVNFLTVIWLPLRTLLFVSLVWGARDLARSLFFPRMLLGKGSAGNATPTTAVISKWIVSLTRIEFYFRRDWSWILILSLCTFLIALLPLGDLGLATSSNTNLVILCVFSVTMAMMSLMWWSSASIVGTAEFLRASNRALLSITILMLIFGYFGMVGLQNVQDALKESAFRMNPFAIAAFICVVAMIQLIMVESPTRTEGWGVHHLTRNFLQVFWYALIIIGFTGALATDPFLIFIEIAFKTATLMILCDALRLFIPEPRGALVDRLTLYLIIPLALILVVSLLYQGVR